MNDIETDPDIPEEAKTKRISQEDLVKDSASSLFANAGRNPDPHLRRNIRFLSVSPQKPKLDAKPILSLRSPTSRQRESGS